MSKKQLLSESEIRRFMALANIPALNESAMGTGEDTSESQYELQEEEDEMGDMDLGSDSPEGEEGPPEMGPPDEPEAEEPMEDEPEVGGMGGGKEDKVRQIIQLIGEISGVDLDISGGDEAGGEEPEGEEEVDLGGMSDEEGEGEEESDEEESEEEESEEEEAEEQELQESIVNAVMARVTARLVSEAKKKESFKEKMKKLRDKKAGKGGKGSKDKKDKKLEEANAPAPKSTNSNAPKKGAGSATKGNWGVNEKIPDQSWEKGTSKRGHKMEDVTPSSEHITTHGKKSLATAGGNKKKV